MATDIADSVGGTVTITHTRGRVVRHTLVYLAGTFNGSTYLNEDLDPDQMPYGVYAGSVWGKISDRSGANTVNLIIRNSATTIGNTNDFNLVDKDQAVSDDPDGFGRVALMEDCPNQTGQNHISDFTLPTREFRVSTNAGAGETGQTFEYWIAMLSHVLDQ